MENATSIISGGHANGVRTRRMAQTRGGVPGQTLTLDTLLEEVHDVFAAPLFDALSVHDGIDRLFHGLRELRQHASEDQWREMIRVGRSHRLMPLVHQDPFTRRAFEKPRGYAGDAVMMDYIYGQEENWPSPPATDLGKEIFRYTTGAPASAGVRERRCYIAQLLDQVARLRDRPSTLAVAAGHLREAGLSVAVRRRQFGRFVALDTDLESVDEIRRCYGRYGIEAVAGNARQMLSGKIALGEFDLIYSTGLYDYLADETAKQLTSNLFQALLPGGRLVVANFLPGIRDVGYMEMYMGWHLIYRNRSQMMSLADGIAAADIEEIRIVAEPNENVVVMEVSKR